MINLNLLQNLSKVFKSKKSDLNITSFVSKHNKIYSKKECNLVVYEYNTNNLNSILDDCRSYEIKPILINNLYFFYIFCKQDHTNIILIPLLTSLITTIDNFCSTYKEVLNDINISYPEKRNILINLYYILNIGSNNKLYEELSYKYDLVIFQKNNIIIHGKIECNLYKSKYGRINTIPEELRTIVNEVKFTANSNNLLVEVKAFTNKNIHPNINYENNKYCTGNFIHKQIDSKLIDNVIENIKIYNLNNYYKLDPSLKGLLCEPSSQ